jgi:hypothetical protein
VDAGHLIKSEGVVVFQPVPLFILLGLLSEGFSLSGLELGFVDLAFVFLALGSDEVQTADVQLLGLVLQRG